MWQNLKNSPAEHTPIPLWILWCCCHGSQFLVLWKSCSLMQSLHVYDYFCYREWNVEGNFAHEMVLPITLILITAHASNLIHVHIICTTLTRSSNCHDEDKDNMSRSWKKIKENICKNPHCKGEVESVFGQPLRRKGMGGTRRLYGRTATQSFWVIHIWRAHTNQKMT